MTKTFPPPDYVAVVSDLPGIEVYAPALTPAGDSREVVPFKCPRCAATTAYSIADGSLICSHCGYRETFAQPAAGTRAKDFEFTVEVVERAERGWNIERKELVCQNCGAHTVVPVDALASTCPFCASNRVIQLEAAWETARNQMREAVREAGRKQALEPANAKQIRNYAVTVDFADETKGDWQSQQLTETRVRWEPWLGRLQRHYDNVTAPAMEKDSALQTAIGDFDLRTAESFDAAALVGALVRLPNRSVKDAWPDALPRFQALAADECRRASRADHMREFTWNSHFEQQEWTQLLLPVYTTYYQDDEGIEHPILVHGQTGEVAGRRQASMRSARRLSIVLGLAAIAMFAASILLVMLSALASAQDTPSGGALWATLGILGVFLAMGLGILAMVPVVYVWLFNRNPSIPTWVNPA